MFRKITGKDASGTGIESDDVNNFGVTWSQITAKQTALDNAAPRKNYVVNEMKSYLRQTSTHYLT